MIQHERLQALLDYITAKGWRWSSGSPLAHGERVIVTDGHHQAIVDFYPKHGKLVFGGVDSPLKLALSAWARDSRAAVPSLENGEAEAGEGNRLDMLKDFIREQGWHWGPGGEIQSGEQIVVSDSTSTALVNYWPKSGKMVVQGVDGALKTVLHHWMTRQAIIGSDREVTNIRGPHIGMDESGKGDWFGPLVVVAVYVGDRVIESLSAIGVRDSKLLDDTAVDRIAREIEHYVQPGHRVVRVIPPQEYNALYAQHGSVDTLLAAVYAEVAAQLCVAMSTETVVCDQFASSKDVLTSAFHLLGIPDPVQSHHAEQISMGVAAASILARAAFTSALQQLASTAGIGATLPKGASDTKVLEAAIRALATCVGSTNLHEYAKTHFKPIQALLAHDSGNNSPATSGGRASATSGPPITLTSPAWRVYYRSTGNFWRYEFSDGGFLDWYPESALGTIYVHGKPLASSVQILQPIAGGIGWKGNQEKLDEAITRRIPRDEVCAVPSVLHIGWCQQETVLGTKFTFTDGAVLNYYRGRDTLVVQGTPSPLTRAALEALSSPYWAGLEALVDTLKRLFPDWRLGVLEQPTATSEGAPMTQHWMPLENALEWRRYWPTDREIRRISGVSTWRPRGYSRIFGHSTRAPELVGAGPIACGNWAR